MSDHGGGCLHCSRKNATRPRGLCYRCYEDRAIRRRYPRRLSAQFHRDFCGPGAEPKPTDAPPATEAKLRAMEERARRGQSLHHAGDAVRDDDADGGEPPPPPKRLYTDRGEAPQGAIG